MRGTRWLLLVAIAAIVFGIGATYLKLKSFNEKNALPAPESLPENVSATTTRGQWTAKDQKTGCTQYELSSDARQAADSTHSELTGVELKLFHKSDGKTGSKCDSKFDLVRSAAATYFISEGRLYAEGEVDITLGEPAEGQPPASLISIKSSGVTFYTDSGKAETDRPATFLFKNGEGRSTGAMYDPPSKELYMKHDVVVDWKAATPHAKPLHIEAPSLVYRETTAEIDLTPTGKVTRDAMVFEGDSPIIRLRADEEGHKFIREIDADKAHGTDATVSRKLAYSADKVTVLYNDDHLVEHIIAEGNAALTSTALASTEETSQTNVTGHHVEMFFDPDDKNKESQLARVTCDGNGVVTSRPLPGPGRTQLADSHTLRSEHIGLKMRPGGKELEMVTAHPSGTLEFLPNQPAGHHRTLVGDEMLIAYAPRNRIETFRSSNVKTTTDPNDEERRNHHAAVSTTASRDFLARFDTQTNQVANIEQTGNFTYQAGDRKAKAHKATLDQKQNVMTLDGGAVVSDLTGTTAAEHIRLDERTDDFVAEGNVSSMRLPDKDQKNPAMLSGDAPLNAQARKMESSNRKGSSHTRYEGNARLWQGANRISAEVVEIDRDKHTLVADGNVVTEAWEQPKDDAKKKAATAVKTTVNAPHLVYTDQDRLAYYQGGVKLTRSDLHLKSEQLHAWLADSKADSQLEKAFADGGVEISGARKDNSYKGNSEHLEYYTDEQKVILNGGAPKLVRTVAGKQPTVIDQPELIYWLDDGSMKGYGPGSDRIPKKK